MKNYSREEVLEEIKSFDQENWRDIEPDDIKRLREHSLPPMGQLPCCFYACFNLFWLGENIQTFMEAAKSQEAKLYSLNLMMTEVLSWSRNRLIKWELKDTVELIEKIGEFYEGGADSYEEFIEVAKETLIALNKVQSWIDAILPWSELNEKLNLREPIEKKVN